MKIEVKMSFINKNIELMQKWNRHIQKHNVKKAQSVY